MTLPAPPLGVTEDLGDLARGLGGKMMSGSNSRGAAPTWSRSTVACYLIPHDSVTRISLADTVSGAAHAIAV